MKSFQFFSFVLEKFDEKLLKKCPKLVVIGKYGVGTNNIDFEALKKNNVKILLQPGINKRAVSELTLSFMIQGLRNSYQLINDVKNNSLDAYARARSAYYQQRDKLLQDNLPKGEVKDDLDEFETFFTE